VFRTLWQTEVQFHNIDSANRKWKPVTTRAASHLHKCHIITFMDTVIVLEEGEHRTEMIKPPAFF
jgi:hypothetical protein